jgi:hypothetical protein
VLSMKSPRISDGDSVSRHVPSGVRRNLSRVSCMLFTGLEPSLPRVKWYLIDVRLSVSNEKPPFQADGSGV